MFLERPVVRDGPAGLAGGAWGSDASGAEEASAGALCTREMGGVGVALGGLLALRLLLLADRGFAFPRDGPKSSGGSSLTKRRATHWPIFGTILATKRVRRTSRRPPRNWKSCS